MNAINIENLKKSYDGQMTGVLLINNTIMFIAGCILFVIDYIFIKKISSRFVREKLI